jgi:hypothetical protein
MTLTLHAVDAHGGWIKHLAIEARSHGHATCLAQDWADELRLTVDICDNRECVGTVKPLAHPDTEGDTLP